jgi:translation initiation factor 6 (eIF-6)
MIEDNNLERPNVDLATFDGNPNIGLYLFATNDYCLAPESTSDKLLHKIEKVLDVPVIKLNIAGTPLLGVFLSGNSEQLLVPSIIFDKEKEIFICFSHYTMQYLYVHIGLRLTIIYL